MTLEDRIRGYQTLHNELGNVQDVDQFKQYLKDTVSEYIDGTREFPLNFPGIDKARGKIAKNRGAMEPIIDDFLDRFADLVGEGMVYEIQAYERVKDLPREEWSNRLPEIIGDLFGGPEEYASYGRAYQQLGSVIKSGVDTSGLGLLNRKLFDMAIGMGTKALAHEGQKIIELADSIPKKK